MTVHLGALDHIEHSTGPFSAESNAALEEIDKMVGVLAKAMRDEAPNSASASSPITDSQRSIVN